MKSAAFFIHVALFCFQWWLTGSFFNALLITIAYELASVALQRIYLDN